MENRPKRIDFLGSLEKSIVFIKPGHLMKTESIFSCLDLSLSEFYGIDFFRISPIFIIPEKEDIEKHYSSIKDKDYFEPTIQEYMNKGMVLSPYFSKQDIIGPIRETFGNTDPRKASSRSIRSIFSTDSLEEAEKENRFLRNVIHSSSNKSDSEKEFKIWNKYFI